MVLIVEYFIAFLKANVPCRSYYVIVSLAGSSGAGALQFAMNKAFHVSFSSGRIYTCAILHVNNISITE